MGRHGGLWIEKQVGIASGSLGILSRRLIGGKGPLNSTRRARWGLQVKLLQQWRYRVVSNKDRLLHAPESRSDISVVTYVPAFLLTSV